MYCASATSIFRRRGVVDDAKQSRITSCCNTQASAGINPLFSAILSFCPLHFLMLVNPGIVPFFSYQAMLTENSTHTLFLLVVSDKFICTYLGKANHVSLI